MIEEKDLSGESLAGAVGGLLADPARLVRAWSSRRARLARPDAAARVADLLESG